MVRLRTYKTRIRVYFRRKSRENQTIIGMNRYLLPYKFNFDFPKYTNIIEVYTRFSVCNFYRFSIWKEKTGWNRSLRYKVPNYHRLAETKEIAMVQLDDILLSEGYIFISNERAEKIRLLLK